jgi:hypothetical protein
MLPTGPPPRCPLWTHRRVGEVVGGLGGPTTSPMTVQDLALLFGRAWA